MPSLIFKISASLFLIFLLLFTQTQKVEANAAVWGRIFFTDEKGNDIGINNVTVVARSEWTECDREEKNDCQKRVEEIPVNSDHSWGVLGDINMGWGKHENIEVEGDGFYLFSLSCGRPDWHLIVKGLKDGSKLPPYVPANGVFVEANQPASDGYMMNIGSYRHDIHYALKPKSVPTPAGTSIHPTVPFMRIKIGPNPTEFLPLFKN